MHYDKYIYFFTEINIILKGNATTRNVFLWLNSTILGNLLSILYYFSYLIIIDHVIYRRSIYFIKFEFSNKTNFSYYKL